MEIDLKKINFDPDLTPPKDAQLDMLMRFALEGSVHVYYAAVPLSLIRPYSTAYLNDLKLHHVGKAAISHIMQEWRKGNFTKMWVYQQDNNFIMSDDYTVFAAAENGQPDFVPCWVLGKPDHPDVNDVQGPIRTDEVAGLLGFAKNDN